MRRVIVLAVLIGAMKLIQPLGNAAFGSQALLAFGLLILGAYAAGELVAAIGLPKLVGYIFGGLAFGPSGLHVISGPSIAELGTVSSLAIALIAFLAGAELHWDEVRERGGVFLRILAVELAVAFVAIVGLLIGLRRFAPFLRTGTTVEVAAFAALFASIAVVHSPAVVMGLLSETKARGPLARTTLGVVLLSDVVVVLLMTAVLAFVRAVVPSSGDTVAAQSVGTVFWHLGGAVIVGAALGALVSIYLRFVQRELFLFAILVAFFGSELARLMHVETLLMLITAGFASENLAPGKAGAALREAMERAAAPVFVVFFALAGAEMAVDALRASWVIVLPLAAVRAAAIWTGTRVGVRLAGITGSDAVVVRRGLWTGLIPQAGVAIGLAAVIAQAYPSRGGAIQSLFLALIAVNESTGAILFRRALARSGEIALRDPAKLREPGLVPTAEAPTP